MSNIVVRNEDKFRTLGNSGQFITEKAVFMQGSIRVSLNNLDDMLDVLRINGHSLHQYKKEIKGVLASINDYNPRLTKEDLKKDFLGLIRQKYGINFSKSELTKEEVKRINELSIQSPVIDGSHYKSMGICYLCLNGRSLLPELDNLLPYKEHSLEEVTRKIREVA